MRAGVDVHVNAQLIAADHAAGRMHEIDVTGIAFGIKRPLDHQRSAVRALDQAGSSAGVPRFDPFC